MRRRKMTMKRAINYIRKYEAEKYDDYDRRDKLTYRERTANEHARFVLDDLISVLEKQESDLAGEKEIADVGINRDGEIPAEDVHGSRPRPAKEVSEIHTGLSKTGSTETSES